MPSLLTFIRACLSLYTCCLHSPSPTYSSSLFISFSLLLPERIDLFLGFFFSSKISSIFPSFSSVCQSWFRNKVLGKHHVCVFRKGGLWLQICVNVCGWDEDNDTDMNLKRQEKTQRQTDKYIYRLIQAHFKKEKDMITQTTETETQTDAIENWTDIQTNLLGFTFTKPFWFEMLWSVLFCLSVLGKYGKERLNNCNIKKMSLSDFFFHFRAVDYKAYQGTAQKTLTFYLDDFMPHKNNSDSTIVA